VKSNSLYNSDLHSSDMLYGFKHNKRKEYVKTKRRLFSVDLNLQKLNDDIQTNSAKNETWFSIIESFIKSFEKTKELVQLLCISQLHLPEDETVQLFSKAVFTLSDEENFEQVLPRIFITREEYYEKLLGMHQDALENKIRLTFEIEDIKFSLEFFNSTQFTIMQVEYPIESEKDDFKVEEIFEKLPSVQIKQEYNLSIEEAFYRLYFHSDLLTAPQKV
jgi:hypothetical protein